MSLSMEVTQLNPEYITFEDRLKSFNTCVSSLKQNAHKYCKAGFYYTGDGITHKLTCFFCNININDITTDMEPWTEHAQFSPNCGFIIITLGEDFAHDVDVLMKNKSAMIKQKEELTKIVTNQVDESIILKHQSNIEAHMTKWKLSSFYEQYNSVPDSALCKICYKQKVQVAFLPCKHTIACIQCSMIIDRCGICRRSFMAMRVNLYAEPEETHDQLLCSSSDIYNKILCKVCHKEEMQVAFMPCSHVYACVNCTTKIHECPVCTKAICYTIPVYL